MAIFFLSIVIFRVYSLSAFFVSRSMAAFICYRFLSWMMAACTAMNSR